MAKTFSLIFTGMSGSGKTTVADEVNKKLKRLGVSVQYIDGDEFREEIGNLFGYTREERMKNNQVVRTVVKYLNANGINVIFTLVAPYEEMRQEMRKQIGDAYIEVFARCSLEACTLRDVKGYYKKQRDGNLQNLNGVDDVYEVPCHSEIVIDTEHDAVEECVNKVLDYLRDNDYIDYKYITGNNLENRQDYMYSLYGGEGFIKAYYRTRECFISAYVAEDETGQKNPPLEYVTEEMGETGRRLGRLLEKLKNKVWTMEVKEELDFYVKAFEVRKRLYSSYEKGTVRPSSDAAYKMLGNYLLLAQCVYYGYFLSEGLKYLNTMLKLDDTLISLAGKMSESEKIWLGFLLRLETNLVSAEEAISC